MLAALLAIFIVVEIVAQLLVWQFAGRPFRSLSFYRWSAYGLVRNNPELTSPSFIINRNGFRAMRDYQRQKPPGVFRVMLFGGSVLYSGIVPAAARLAQYGRVHSEQTIAPYLEEKLRQDPAFAGVEIEVINAAINFNRIVEISSAYLAEYLHWLPDAVVVFGALNNFSGVRHHGDVAAGRTDLQRPHPWHAEFQRLVNDHGIASTIERLWRSGAEHSAALTLASKIAVIGADQLATVTWKFRPRIAHAMQPSAPKEIESVEEREAFFRIYASYADAMIAAARRSGQAIAFAWEPHLADLEGIKPLSAEEQTLLPAVRGSAEARAQYEQSRLRFRRLFDDGRVPVVDPTEAFRNAKETIFLDYGHYTPAGNRFVADVAFEQLRPMLIEQLARARAAGGPK
ncbi:MAG: hypothetical protein HY543_00990 [Deltaproteobacteria bacterium]|nr:hypothetical protein [Deltaproteobacteria bacterium]